MSGRGPVTGRRPAPRPRTWSTASRAAARCPTTGRRQGRPHPGRRAIEVGGVLRAMRNCSFRTTGAPIPSGILLYQLDVIRLEVEESALHAQIRDYLHDEVWPGCVARLTVTPIATCSWIPITSAGHWTLSPGCGAPRRELIWLSTVDTRTGRKPQIVWGGIPIVKAGSLVPVAQPGTWLPPTMDKPNRYKIRRRRYAGEISEWMLYSLAELGWDPAVTEWVALLDPSAGLDAGQPLFPAQRDLPVY